MIMLRPICVGFEDNFFYLTADNILGENIWNGTLLPCQTSLHRPISVAAALALHLCAT